MGESERVDDGPREPEMGGPAGGDRWADYLEWLREDIATTVLGLSPEDQRTPRVPSGWTPLELLSHVLHMEQRWFVWGFLGEAVAEPWGDWNVPEPWTFEGTDDSGGTRPQARWQVHPDTTAEDLVGRLRAVGGRTRSILGRHAPETPGAVGGRFGDDPPTLEWICFHVLAEYARHAGHLDVSTEIAGA